MDDGIEATGPRRWWQRPGGFLAVALLIPLVALATIAAGLYVAGERGPVATTGGNTTHVYFWKRKQDTLAGEAVGSRILLFGGSGVLFSVRAQTLSSRLGGPAVNMGLIAGFGLDYILHRARAELRPNDIAVLFLEYGLFVNERGDWSLADYVVPFDLPYLARIGPAQVIDLAGLVTPEEYGRKLHGGVFGTPIDGNRIANQLNAFGDFTENAPAAQKDYHQRSLDQARTLDAYAISPNQVRKIADFITWCRARGIHVVAGFPALMDDPAYHVAPRSDFYSSIVEIFRRRGVPVLGEPQEFMHPKPLFFDSAYHLNAVGAARMSELVASRLSVVLRCEVFHRWNEAPTPECARLRSPILVDLARTELPPGIAAISGFYERENWGRWTDGAKSTLQMKRALAGPLHVDIDVTHIFAERTPLEVTARIGTETRRFVARVGTITVDFDAAVPADSIDIELPQQRSPKDAERGSDPRRLGLGVASITVRPGSRTP